jgi:hypothetical protein
MRNHPEAVCKKTIENMANEEKLKQSASRLSNKFLLPTSGVCYHHQKAPLIRPDT